MWSKQNRKNNCTKVMWSLSLVYRLLTIVSNSFLSRSLFEVLHFMTLNNIVKGMTATHKKYNTLILIYIGPN